MVRVQRYRLPGLVDDAVGRHPAAFGVAGGDGFRTRGVTVVTHHHFLMAGGDGEQHGIVEHAERIAQQPALRAVAGGGQRIEIVTADGVVIRAIESGSVINVGQWPVGFRRGSPGGFVFFGDGGVTDVHLVRDNAGIKVAAHARHAAEGINNAVSVEASHPGVTVFVDHVRRGVQPDFMAVLRAKSGVGRPRVGDIYFRARHTEFVFDIAVAPLLAVVVAGIR